MSPSRAVRVPVHGWYNSIKKIGLSGKELISDYGKTERNHYVNIPSLKKLSGETRKKCVL